VRRGEEEGACPVLEHGAQALRPRDVAAEHSRGELDTCLGVFERVGRELTII
jgi:hypothetical protein